MGSSYITDIYLFIYLFMVYISGTSYLTQKPATHLLMVKQSCIEDNGNSGFIVSHHKRMHQ